MATTLAGGLINLDDALYLRVRPRRKVPQKKKRKPRLQFAKPAWNAVISPFYGLRALTAHEIATRFTFLLVALSAHSSDRTDFTDDPPFE